MANELRHKEVISGRVRETEYEHIRQHILNDQAAGDLVYASSATQLSGLPIGTENQLLRVSSGGLPEWASTLSGLTFDNATLTGKPVFGGVTDWGAGATGTQITGAGYDWVTQTVGRVNANLNGTAAAAHYAAMSITANQTSSNSIFGHWVELYVSNSVDLTGADNFAAIWGQFEAGTGVTLSDTGCFTAGLYANVKAGATLTVAAGHSLNGVRAQIEVAAITNNGKSAAFECLKGSGVDWDYGLYVANATTGIYIGACTTGINIASTATDGIIIGGATTRGINISGAASSAQLYIGGTAILASGEQAIYINTPLETTATNGLWITLGSTVTSGDLSGIRSRVTGNAASAGANVRGAYLEAKGGASNYAATLEGALIHADYSAGSITVSGDVRGLAVQISDGASLTAANLYGILLNIQTLGTESGLSDDVGLMIRNQAVGGNGRTMDAAIKIAELNMGGVTNGFTDDIIFHKTSHIRDESGYLTIYGTAGYVRIGDAGTTSNSLASEDDLLVTGRLEVDGVAYLDSTVTTGGHLGVDIASHANYGIRYQEIYADPSSTKIGIIAQLFGEDTSSANSNILTGFYAEAGVSSNNTQNWTASGSGSLQGCYGFVTFEGSGTMTAASSLVADATVYSGCTMTSRYGLYIVNASGAGAVTTQYGIYIADLTKGGTDYGIYIAGADTAAIVIASSDPLQLGVAGSATGVMNIQGATSGVVTLTVAAVAGTWTMTLPVAVGTAGYFLVDAAGDGITSWSKTLPASTIVAGSLFAAELANAVADAAGYGQFWVKNNTPNTPYFTDDTGVDQQIQTADYAGITIDGNAGATTIDVVDNFVLIDVFDADMPERISNGAHGTNNITIGATGVYRVRFDMSGSGGGTNKTFEVFAFELNASGEPIASTTDAEPVVVTDVGHPFVNGNRIKITGVTTADELNDRIFTVTKLTADTYSLQDDEGVAIDGTGFGAGTGGTATLATILTVVHTHRKFTTADVGSLSGGGLVSLTKDKTLELYIKGITDATNPTIEYCSFYMHRIS